MVNDESKKNIDSFLNSLRMNEPVTNEELRAASESAIRDRSRFFYSVWKTIQEMHPDIDADAIMREASKKFGSCRSDYFSGLDDCREVVKNDFPKDAMLVYEVEITELGPDKAVCNFHHCPHMAAFKELGCSEEEMQRLCLDMLIHGDYAAYEGSQNIELSFSEILARNEGVCGYTLTKKE